MAELYRKGALRGDAEGDAFYVKCNGDTTSAVNIERGVVRIDVGYAKACPGEFTRL